MNALAFVSVLDVIYGMINILTVSATAFCDENGVLCFSIQTISNDNAFQTPVLLSYT